MPGRARQWAISERRGRWRRPGRRGSGGMRRAGGGERHPEPSRPDGRAAPKCARAFSHGFAGSRSREEETTGTSVKKGMAFTEEEDDSRRRATTPKKENERDKNIPLAGGKVKKSKRWGPSKAFCRSLEADKKKLKRK